ncbi:MULTISPECIES: MarR family transcriptional regulator [unclassified Brevibacillus]|uniref:MarR family transcriptional regulator n=1 Tax=unclassified Brevibacillus TaxID=2684853 RepID=UPI00156B49DB|nr:MULTISPECIES: MarR family transcriptional regulator [unclassified Brevibacillus]NRR00721.1 MarR family transcriptional regulator [Brevibacillus sp. RS1.1]NRS50029.1 MarR family transcriptional regulator [Brevibacillus sp. HB2.2]
MIVFGMIICIWLLSLWLLPILQPYVETFLLSTYGDRYKTYIPYEMTALHYVVYAMALGFILGLPLEIKYKRAKSKWLKKLKFHESLESDNILLILSLARDQQGYVTAADIASQSTLTIEKAQNILSKLQKDGFADLSVTEKGDILYYFEGFSEGEV